MLENLRAMAVFAAVVECGSFSGAAKNLGITTSAVSQQIRTLENELGVMLLHRSTRKLNLTEAGSSLYVSAQTMVKAAQDAKNNISELRDGLLGSLHIATTPILARHHLLPALKQWFARHGDLSLHISTSSQAVDMIDERVDVLVDFMLGKKESITTLAKVNQVLVASPNYLNGCTLTQPKQLSEHPFISSNVNEQIGFLGGGSVKVKAGVVTNDETLALALTKAGYGLLHTNALYVRDLLMAGELVLVLPEHQLPPLTLYAQIPNKTQTPTKVRHCLEALSGYFGGVELCA